MIKAQIMERALRRFARCESIQLRARIGDEEELRRMIGLLGW